MWCETEAQHMGRCNVGGCAEPPRNETRAKKKLIAKLRAYGNGLFEIFALQTRSEHIFAEILSVCDVHVVLLFIGKAHSICM